MEATDILVNEHRLIEHVLGALERRAQSLQEGAAVRTEFFLDAVDFIRNYADGCHHRKEEGALFPAMIEAGIPEENGPIAVMLGEHEQGRVFNRGMEKAAKAGVAGGTAHREDLIRNALGYAALLRQHIRKENEILFPMAERVIPPAAQNQLAVEFERIEREETGAGVHEKYHAMAEAMAEEAGR
ncbi:MAG: hemerythrin domain-containing protein [Anaerolineales bacterium]|nr:hemerythrin domain-containing protein [Anaerolineales bacterium]